MGRKNTSADRRAKKRHQKALKRARQLARRREEQERRARQQHVHHHHPLEDWVPRVEGVEGLAHRLEMSHFEAAYEADEHPKLPDELWSQGRVRSLPMEELVRRLGALGLAVTEESFRETFAEGGSVSAAAERAWLPALGPEATVHDRDFVRLAACELHRRWLPEAFSYEAMISAFLDGLRAYESEEDERAVEHGLRLWRMLRPRLSADMSLSEDVDELLDLYETFSPWPREFAASALNAVKRRTELAAPAAQVLDEVVAQFTEEREGWRVSLQGDRAQLLEAAGHSEEAERLLRRLIDEHPDAAAGYALLADLLSRPGANAESHQRARELLEAAAARPVKDGEDWDLDERLRELRKASS